MTVFEVGQRIEKAGLKTRQFDHHETYVWKFEGKGALTVNFNNGEYVGYTVSGSDERIEEMKNVLKLGD